MRDQQARRVQAQAGHEQEEDASEAQIGQDRDAQTDASPDPRTRTLARRSPARALQLLRGARQQRGYARLPTTGHLALAGGARAPQPERPDHLAADRPPRRTMATPTPHPSPLARRALRRQNPREEPSALTRMLGSVRGAAGNGGPYRDCCSRWVKRCGRSVFEAVHAYVAAAA